MKCNKCGQENTPVSRFCCGCGSKLEKLCPQCQQPLPETARFCPHCGTNLSGVTNVSATMNDNVIAGDVNQSVHTNITNLSDHSVHASVVHIHDHNRDKDNFKDLRCHVCAAFIPAAQKYISTCYKCGKHFCAQHLMDGYCATCKTEQQLDMFEFVRQGNKKYSITKLKDLHAMRVSVPAIVESIGNKAFMGAEVIEVTLPEGLLKIGVQAFANCKDLTRINFPNSLGIIENQAFQNCESLYAEPPAGTRVGKDAFAGTLYANPQERARRAEEARKAEQARIAEEDHKLEELIKAEEAHKAEEARKAEQARILDGLVKAEEARLAAAARKADLARRVEESRKAQNERRRIKDEAFSKMSQSSDANGYYVGTCQVPKKSYVEIGILLQQGKRLEATRVLRKASGIDFSQALDCIDLYQQYLGLS